MSGKRTAHCRPLLHSLVGGLSLCVCLLWGLHSQSIAAEGMSYESTEWGGTLVAERIPHQPSSLLEPTEPTHLPPVAPSEFDPTDPLRIAQITTTTIPNADDLPDVVESQLPPGARNGVFQKLLFTGTWLPRFDDNGLGWSTLDSAVVFALPFFKPSSPLIITPRFAAHFLDAPDALDLPTEVYDASIEFRHYRRFGLSPWAMDVAVTLGEYSDFAASSSDSFRVTGRGVAIYEAVPGVKWIAGAAYVNLANVSVLPVAGVIYDPSPHVSWELLLPRPRVAFMLPNSIVADDERWWYVGAEFYGGVWSIQRPVADLHDVMNYTDYRIMTGYERKIFGGLSRHFEIGYVLGRKLEFQNAAPDISLNDTLYLRAGLSY